MGEESILFLGQWDPIASRNVVTTVKVALLHMGPKKDVFRIIDYIGIALDQNWR